MIYLTVVGVAVAALLVVVGCWVSTDLLLRTRLKAVVLVELKSGETFKGVLAGCDRRTVVLRNVEAIPSERAAPMVVDGELLIPRLDVKFMQRP